jgi:hypothetical protein
MVLANAASPSPTDPPPQSNNDGPGLQLNIDFAAQGVKDPRLQKRYIDQITSKFSTIQTVLGRPITNDEANAMVQHILSVNKTVLTWRTFGLYGSMLAAWFIPYKAWPRGLRIFKPSTVANRDWITMKAGTPMAMAGWQSTRMMLQVFMMTTVVQFISVPYAEVRAATNAAMDPRLKAMNEELARYSQKSGGRFPRQGTQTGSSQQQTQSWENDSQLAQEAARAAREAYRKDEPDDASPTSGNDPWMSAEPEPSNIESNDTRPQQSSSNDWGSDRSDSSWDDASPAAQQQSNPESSGSAWERLRQQAEAQKQGGRRSNQPTGGRGQVSSQDSQGKDEKWW